MSVDSRLRTTRTVLALIILGLLAGVAWQESRITSLNNEVAQTRRTLDLAVERMSIERLKTFRREELAAAIQWLDDFYRSAEGLQRPGGLWRQDLNKPDAEAIGAWILDVYLQERVAGKSDAEAKQAIVDQIRGTDEWRLKHPKRDRKSVV